MTMMYLLTYLVAVESPRIFDYPFVARDSHPLRCVYGRPPQVGRVNRCDNAAGAAPFPGLNRCRTTKGQAGRAGRDAVCLSSREH